MTTRKSNSVIEQLKRLHRDSKPASPDSMGDGFRSQYVAMVIADHQSGKTDALKNYREVYGDSHVQAEDESDLDWIRRCAEQDYHDGASNAAVYQDFYDAVVVPRGEKKFIRCEESILGLLSSLGAEFDFGAYDHSSGGVDATVNLTALARIAEFPADFKVEDGRLPIRRYDVGQMEGMEESVRAFHKRNDAFWHSVSGFFSTYERPGSVGSVRDRDSRESCVTMSQAEFASAYLSHQPGHAFDDASPGNAYGKVRVATMYGGLVPVREFDAVEIENMTDDPNASGELIVADDYWHDQAHQPDTVTAISVRLHYRRGGVETVSDFCFDPTTPGRKEEAESKARDLAVSLSDMIMMADPELKVEYVLGRGAVEPQRDRSNELTC